MIYTVFALDHEADKINAPNKVIIGEGACELRKFHPTEDDIIINVGYCGGYKVAKGDIFRPKWSMKQGSDPVRLCGIDDITCFTADQFVEEPVSEERMIYDMELYKLAQLPHAKIYPIKLVSDTLNMDEYMESAFSDNDAWPAVQSVVDGILDRINNFNKKEHLEKIVMSKGQCTGDCCKDWDQVYLCPVYPNCYNSQMALENALQELERESI